MLFKCVTAFSLIRLLASRGQERVANYGFRLRTLRHVVSAVIVSAPISFIVALLPARAREPGPLAGLVLSTWLIAVYFTVGAPVQEEVIFRGLLQTTLANRGTHPSSSGVASGVAALLFVALFEARDFRDSLGYWISPYLIDRSLISSNMLGLGRPRQTREPGSVPVRCAVLFDRSTDSHSQGAVSPPWLQSTTHTSFQYGAPCVVPTGSKPRTAQPSTSLCASGGLIAPSRNRCSSCQTRRPKNAA